MLKFLWVDTETTGTDPLVHDPIQIAGIIEVGTKYQEFDITLQPINPKAIADAAIASHGISYEEMMSFQEPKKGYEQFKILLNTYVNPYVKEDKFILCGQNVGFDSLMIKHFFEKLGDKFWFSYISPGMLDLMSLAVQYEMIHGCRIFPNYQLLTICETLGIELIGAHNAMNDVIAARQCCIYIWNYMKEHFRG